MIKSLLFTLIGSCLFLATTLVVLKYSSAGVQVEGLMQAILLGGIIKVILVSATLIGGVCGGLGTIVFRKSLNQRQYVWTIMIIVLIFTEFVIATIF